jgi:hypothetical protein
MMSGFEIINMYMEDDDNVYVEAIVEDKVLIRHSTYLEPEEYGPAKCFTFVHLSDVSEYESDIGLGIPIEYPLDGVREYLNCVKVDWEVVDDDYDD